MLCLMRERNDVYWVLGGDFNDVSRCEERKGLYFSRRGAMAFNFFISSAELIEPPLGGRKFTWISADGKKGSQLDRFLLSDQLAEKWTNAHWKTLPRRYSDHSPILLDFGGVDFGPIPFKFFNSWLKVNSLHDLVKENWNISDEGALSFNNIQKIGLKLKHII